MVAFRSIGSVHQRLLLSVVIISGLVPLISPIAPLASATTPQELQQCLDKFNNKDIISSSLSVADQTLLSTCRASSDCKDAGEGSLIGSRRITCTNPANNQAYQDATQKASTAETAPLIKLTCGGGGGGDTAISNYQACAQKVTSAYDACSSSGGGVTGQIQVSASSTATCLAQKYPTYTVADLQGAIESGRSAKAGILNTAANGASSTSGTASAEQAPSNACGIPDITGPLAWVMCPITSGLATFAKFLANRVGDLLYVSPETAFNDSFHGAWTSFRNIGLALVVIAGLFMVISQALGLEFLDAYTIRKLMPRLAVVMIGMTLSWPLLVQLVVLFNDLGIWAHNLILTPFDAAKVGWNAFNISSPAGAMGSANQLVIASVIERGILGVGAAGLFIGAGLLGWSGILALIGTVVLALLIGLLVLASRQVILMAAILMAPLAIACYVLPGTQKVWAFWKNTVITTLAMFPIIMGFIAIGEALSRLIAETSPSGSPWQFFAILVFFAPYFMLPFAFKLAGGLMSTVFSLANDKSRGLFDRAKKFRQDTMAYRKGEFASGNKKGPNLAVGYARRSVLAKQGGFTPGRHNQAQYRMAARKLAQDSARERAEKDHGYSLGDTDETRAAIFANSRKDYMTAMTQKYKDNAAAKGQVLSHEQATRMAQESMARLEAGTQSEMGGQGMKLAAMRGQTTLDGAGWWKDGKFDHEGYGKAAKHMMDEGLMRAEDLGAMMAENAQRGDMNMGTFSERVNYNKAIQEGGLWEEDAAGNKSFVRMSTDEIAKRGRASMYRGIKSSQAITANLRTAEETSQIGVERIQAALTGDTSTVGTKNMNGGDVLLGAGAGTMDSVAAEFAQYGNYQEMMGYASGTNREEFSKKLMSTPVGELKGEAAVAFAKMQEYYQAQGKQMTHQDMLEALRGNSGGLLDAKYVQMYTARHRELSARAVAESGGRFSPSESVPTGTV